MTNEELKLAPKVGAALILFGLVIILSIVIASFSLSNKSISYPNAEIIKTNSGQILSLNDKLTIWRKMEEIENLATKEAGEQYPLVNSNGISLSVTNEYIMKNVSYNQGRLSYHKYRAYQQYNISEATYTAIMGEGFKENWDNVMHIK